jgi:uncharacterized membrane protein YdjX (TVP38/TMEM64 family)
MQVHASSRVEAMAAGRTHRSAVAVAAVAAGVVALAALLPIRGAAGAFAAWGQRAGAVGVLAFAAAQFACTLLVVPAWPLRVAAGFVWGFAGGLAVSLPSGFGASVLAFVVGRRLLRERVARRLARDPRLAAVDGAVAARGFSAVLLVRLSPVVPNEAANYALGLTGVALRPYALATALGMIPTTATYVAAGALATAAGDLAQGRAALGGGTRATIAGLGIAATLVAAVALVRIVRRALERPAAAAPALVRGR